MKLSQLLFICLIGIAHGLSAEIDPIVDSIVGQSTYPYRMFIPQGISEQNPVPLVIFLHGSGERGTDNMKQVQNYIGPLIASTQEDNKYKAILVAPQMTSGWSGSQVNALAEDICNNYPVDRLRCYLTGLSAGGYGVYDALANQPDRWAAGLVLSGTGNSDAVSKLAETPLWIIHGKADSVVVYQASETMYKRITRLGGTPRITLIDGMSHCCWNRIYEDNPDYTVDFSGGDPDHAMMRGIYAWMFSHSIEPEAPAEILQFKEDFPDLPVVDSVWAEVYHMGWVHLAAYPWVYSLNTPGWIYLQPSSTPGFWGYFIK